ncbi:MAG: hypothetical protein HY820_36470 [Acidobacteria bacterium]|nr:hypothetical protein [Acidobacteriota bacterium]
MRPVFFGTAAATPAVNAGLVGGARRWGAVSAHHIATPQFIAPKGWTA